MAQQLTDEQAKRVYRSAIDSRTREKEGASWWSAVAEEMRSVCAAATLKSAAAIIEWWHGDWSMVGDAAQAAAKRICAAARTIKTA